MTKIHEENSNMKKVFNIIKDILVWMVVILTVGIMIFTVISVNTFDQNNRSIFGYKFYIVQSDSMSATDFDAGDVILIRNVNPATLAEGDIIAYISQNSHNYGETVTHKIRRIVTDSEGEPGFVTYGTTTNTDDETVVTYPYVLGKYTGKISGIGNFFQFLKTTPGYILCIFVPFLILIGYNGINCIRLFRRYKKEQMEELQAEKNKIAEERRQSEAMMKELMALREQLGQAVSGMATAQAKAVAATESDEDDLTILDLDKE